MRFGFSWSAITEDIHLLAWNADKREVLAKDAKETPLKGRSVLAFSL